MSIDEELDPGQKARITRVINKFKVEATDLLNEIRGFRAEVFGDGVEKPRFKFIG